MMMGNNRDTTTDLLLHFDSSLVNAKDLSSPSNTYNSTQLAYTTGHFGQGIYTTSQNIFDFPIGLEYNLPYNGKHDFTIDFWAKSSTQYSGVGIGKSYTSFSLANVRIGCDFFLQTGLSSDPIPVIYHDGDSTPYSSQGSASYSNFNHFAICYNYATNTLYVFVNGTLTSTITNASTNSLTTSNKLIVVLGDPESIIDEVRVSNVVRWTASFTPPTAPYTI